LPIGPSLVHLSIRIHKGPRGAALSLLHWLICALVPAWLGLGSNWAAAAVVDAVVVDAVVVDAAVIDLAVLDPEREGAPMCDPHGASVAATPEVPVGDHGKLEQLPCDDAWLLWLGSELQQARGHAWSRNSAPSSPPAELQLERARLDGVMPLVTVMPGRAQPIQLPRSEVAGLPVRPGHRFSIYRPPVRGR
jgi:hypothetical protein